MRGKDFHRSGFQTSDRITPAWAGKSPARRWRGSGQWDHPRVGGEKGYENWGDGEPNKSPPRGRGKGPTFSGIFHPGGITPAWAGKSTFNAPTENKRRGSPPRGRGKVSEKLTGANYARITPAWAGKRVKFVYLITPPWDHPRVGGEKRKNPRGCDVRQGSPPRGRGKDSSRVCRCGSRRITPAWAGKSTN